MGLKNWNLKKMKVTITLIELKSPFKFFSLSILQEAYWSNFILPMRSNWKKGIYRKHYTMSLWKNEKDLKKFAYSGAHLHAMKKAYKIAKEIRTLTMMLIPSKLENS